MNTDAALWIDPARRCGKVCVTGTRIDVAHVARNLDHYESFDSYCEHFGFDPVADRRNLIVACAYWVLNDRSRDRFDRELRHRWQSWAEQTWERAWDSDAPLELPSRQTEESVA